MSKTQLGSGPKTDHMHIELIKIMFIERLLLTPR